MIGLNDLAFGNIKVREILGAEPDLTATNNMLEQEILILEKKLENMTKEEMNVLKIKQEEIQKEIDSRPGAMALPQKKIRLFTEYCLRYTKYIDEKINSSI